MGFKRFSVLLAIRLLAIMAAILTVGFLILQPGYHAATLLGLLIILLQASDIFRFVSRTNREIARFLDAARYADFSQRFEMEQYGAGFGELGDTFTEILERFRQHRDLQAKQLHHLNALMEHVPVPLISIYNDDTITLWNNAARRLFGINPVTKLSDLQQFGMEFYSQIQSIKTGEQRLATFHVDEMEQRLKISASQITIQDQSERLLSLQNIQSELDGMQLKAWQDLVRVLTHEIMNSITPVTSLAQTAASLVSEASRKLTDNAEVTEVLEDARSAVETVARRSDSLLNFVSSYRQLTQLQAPNRSSIPLADLFADIEKIATINWATKDLQLTVIINPPQLHVTADRQMLEQVLINLLKNAEQALESTDRPRVTLSSQINKRGHVTIEVTDNGPGITEDIAAKIFVPFYTTRREGSGVGLALSRQIMLAHNGSISYTRRAHKETIFRLIF